MKNIKRSRATMGFIALIATGGIILSGCTNGDEPSDPEASNTASAEAPPVEGEEPTEETPSETDEEAPTDDAPPEALEIEDKALQEAAQKYVTVRENQASHNHKKAGDWLGDAKKYMTKDGYKRLTEQVGSPDEASGGYAWNISHDQGLAVKVEMGECVELTQAGNNTDTSKTVSCAVTDIVVDKKGKPVPTTDIPATWPYVGEQQDALLAMKKDGEGWKVDMDMTGMAN